MCVCTAGFAGPWDNDGVVCDGTYRLLRFVFKGFFRCYRSFEENAHEEEMSPRSLFHFLSTLFFRTLRSPVADLPRRTLGCWRSGDDPHLLFHFLVRETVRRPMRALLPPVTWSFIIKKRADMAHGVNGKPPRNVGCLFFFTIPAPLQLRIRSLKSRKVALHVVQATRDSFFFLFLYSAHSARRLYGFRSPLVPHRPHVAPVR